VERQLTATNHLNIVSYFGVLTKLKQCGIFDACSNDKLFCINGIWLTAEDCYMSPFTSNDVGPMVRERFCKRIIILLPIKAVPL
jgi:hypothetical protein